MTAAGPTAPGTTTRGSTQTMVTVQSVSGTIAIVTDQTGRQLQVRRDLQRAKGYLPQAGEQWIIDKAINNTWTFALCITPANSVNTDIAALQYFVQESSNVLCLLTLASSQSLGANTNVFASTGWQVESDFLNMATLSTVFGTPSVITLPIAGVYRVSLRGTIASVTGASMAAFVTYNQALATSSVVRDNRASVPSGLDGTWVNPDREVFFAAGTKLYWGFWCSSATTLNTNALGQLTELEVRCVLPAAQT